MNYFHFNEYWWGHLYRSADTQSRAINAVIVSANRNFWIPFQDNWNEYLFYPAPVNCTLAFLMMVLQELLFQDCHDDTTSYMILTSRWSSPRSYRAAWFWRHGPITMSWPLFETCDVESKQDMTVGCWVQMVQRFITNRSMSHPGSLLCCTANMQLIYADLYELYMQKHFWPSNLPPTTPPT